MGKGVEFNDLSVSTLCHGYYTYAIHSKTDILSTCKSYYL